MKALLLCLIFLSLSVAKVHAQGEHAGGGDYKSEARVKNIRDNILQWIESGRAQKLNFSDQVSYNVYVNGDSKRAGMRAVLNPTLGTVVVNFILTSEETKDFEHNTLVGGQHKTCKWFISQKDKRRHILCNTERFWDQSEADQYRLIHHEYAGLAGVEATLDSDSDYYFSNQITYKLEQTQVLRLPITDPLTQVEPDPSVFKEIDGYWVQSAPLTEADMMDKLWVGRCFTLDLKGSYGAAAYFRPIPKLDGPIGATIHEFEIALANSADYSSDKFDSISKTEFLHQQVFNPYLGISEDISFASLHLRSNGSYEFAKTNFRKYGSYIVSIGTWVQRSEEYPQGIPGTEVAANCYYYIFK